MTSEGNSQPHTGDLQGDRVHLLASMAALGRAVMVLVDPETLRVVEVSPAAEEFYGRPRSELIGVHIPSVSSTPPDVAARATKAALDGTLRHHESVHRTANGVLRDVDVHYRGVRIEGHDYVLATVADATARKLATEELQAGEERYRRLVELTPDAMFVGAGGRFVFVNPAAARLFGAEDPAEIVGRESFQFIHPDDHEKLRERMTLLREGRPVPRARMRYLRLDGSVAHVEAVAVPTEYEGKPATQVLAHEIGDRLEVERLQAWNAAIVSCSRDAIFGIDRQSVVLNWNPAAEELYGYSACEIVGTSGLVLVPEERREEAEETLRQVAEGGEPFSDRAKRRRKDGSLVDVEVTYSPIREPSGGIAGVSIVSRDTSPCLELERAKEDFLSLVSHELRRPLTAIRGYAELLAIAERSYPALERARMAGRVIERAAVMESLIEELLAAARLRSDAMRLQLQEVDPALLVESLAESLPEKDRRRLLLVTDGGAAETTCDPKWMAIALGNLIGNALKFSPPHEPVVVEVAGSASATEFRIRDRGEGLDAETSSRIFDRFVQGDTVPAQGQDGGGVGLGLYITKRIVELHGGRLTVDCAPDEGTVFTIALHQFAEERPKPEDPAA